MVESVVFDNFEVWFSFVNDGGFIVILEVGVNIRKIDNNGDIEGVKFSFGFEVVEF